MCALTLVKRGGRAHGPTTIWLRRGRGRLCAYLPFLLPPISSGLPAFELAVAKTLGFSFFGFLVSRLPLFFSLDMGMIFQLGVPRGHDALRGADAQGRSGLPAQGAGR